MSNRFGDLDHYNKFNNPSGDTPDEVGSRDISYLNTVTYEGDHVHFDDATNGLGDVNGVADYFDVAGNGEFSWFASFRMHTPPSSVSIFSPKVSGVRAPSLTYASVGQNLSFGLRSATGPTINWALTGLVPTHLDEEIILVGGSWNPVGNVLLATNLKTLSGHDKAPSINSTGSANVASPIRFANSAFGSLEGDMYDWGVIIGEALSQDDLDDTQAAFLALLAGGRRGDQRNSIIRSFRRERGNARPQRLSER